MEAENMLTSPRSCVKLVLRLLTYLFEFLGKEVNLVLSISQHAALLLVRHQHLVVVLLRHEDAVLVAVRLQIAPQSLDLLRVFLQPITAVETNKCI